MRRLAREDVDVRQQRFVDAPEIFQAARAAEAERDVVRLLADQVVDRVKLTQLRERRRAEAHLEFERGLPVGARAWP